MIRSVLLVSFFLLGSWSVAQPASPTIIGKWKDTRSGTELVIDDSLRLGSRYGSVKLQWRPLINSELSVKRPTKLEAELEWMKNPFFSGYYYGFVEDSHGVTYAFGRRGRFTFYKHLAEVRIDPAGLLHISYWETDAVGGGSPGQTRTETEHHDVYRRL